MRILSATRASRVLASASSVASVLLLATCDLDKLTAPTVEGGTGGSLSGLFTVTGDSTLLLGGSGLLSVSASGSGASTARWSSSNTSVATVDSVTGEVTGVAIGNVAVTARILLPELGEPVVKTHALRVRYKGLVIQGVGSGLTDSLTAIGQTRAITVRGTNALDVPQGAVNAVLSGGLAGSDTIFRLEGTTIRARRGGTANLTATFGGLSTIIAVRVRQVPVSVIAPDAYVANAMSATPNPGAQRRIPIIARDAADSLIPQPVLRWRAADTTVVAIDSVTGFLRAKRKDTTTIFVRADTIERAVGLSVSQVPATVLMVAGDAQTDTVWTQPSILPEVQVVDSGGTPITGVEVRWRIGSGDGFVGDSVRVTGDGGFAGTNGWLLGKTAGTNTLQAVAGSASATFTATGLPDAPATLRFITQPDFAHLHAFLQSVQVGVADRWGNIAPGVGAAITVALASNPGGAPLEGTLTQSAISSIATFDDLRVPAAGAGYTLVASSPGLGDGISDAFDRFGDATQLVFLTQPGATPGDATIAPPLLVAVKDAAGVTVTTSAHFVAIAIDNNPGSGSLGGTPGRSVVRGVATFDDLSITAPGIGYTLRASSFGVSDAISIGFDIVAAGAPASQRPGGR